MASDFLAFTEGEDFLSDSGLPATCRFLLSTKPCSGAGAHTIADTLSGTGVGEIAGTGYGRQSQPKPAATSGSRNFSPMSWSTGAATDWPSGVKSVVLVTSADNSGKAICAWNLVAGGTARDLSQASTTENFTPSLSFTS